MQWLVVSGNIRFMRTFAARSLESDVKRHWGKSRFQCFQTLRLRHLRKWGQHYYIIHDLEWPFNLKFCFAQVRLEFLRGFFLETIALKIITVDPYCPQQMFSINSSFWWYKTYADIRVGSQDLFKFSLDLRMPLSIQVDLLLVFIVFITARCT